jgi:hypothetical protein
LVPSLAPQRKKEKKQREGREEGKKKKAEIMLANALKDMNQLDM